MTDPFTLGALGALAATEGIKFLYSQAGEVLKRWRDKKAGKDAQAEAPVSVDGADVLEGGLVDPRIDFEALGRLEEDIRELAKALGDYAGGLDEPDANDRDLVAAADGLRRALEVVYGQRITFKGEQRESSGPIVIGTAQIDKVVGDVAGVRTKLARSGRITGRVESKELAAGAKASGVEADTIG